MKISIITANYNYAKYLEDAINSVLSQSYQDWELIIVDDGSSDNSIEIIKSYCEKDERIKLFGNVTNKGLKESLLVGLEQATGDWIAFLESDDIFEPDNLEKKVEIIKKNPNIKLVFNKVKFLAEEKRKQQKFYEKTQEKLSKMNFPKNMFYDFSVDNMILTFSCVIVEAKALKEADFNTPVDSSLDRWLWIHLAQKNDFYYIDKELTQWRLHSESYIKRQKKPAFYFPQISAYFDIFKKDKKLCLLPFILYSLLISFFVRLGRSR